METAPTVIPLISTGTAGPLGAVHLPRLWAKLTLDAAGRLAPGYDACSGGFDDLTLRALNLDRDAMFAYVREHRPTYPQFEAWVLQCNGGSIARERIDAHNAKVLGFQHKEERAAQIRAACGVTDENVRDGVTLNMLDDLHELYGSIYA